MSIELHRKNYKRRARQHYMEGLMPSQIKRTFKIDFGMDISESSIVNWIRVAAEPLREVLKETPVPSSGYWGYDEIHLRVGGEKMYAINTVDLNTRFIPVAKISTKMGRTQITTVYTFCFTYSIFFHEQKAPSLIQIQWNLITSYLGFFKFS